MVGLFAALRIRSTSSSLMASVVKKVMDLKIKSLIKIGVSLFRRSLY